MATRLLLDHGADENMQSSCGWSPLHASVEQGFFEVSQLLIGVGSNINLRNEIHETPIYIAVKNKHDQLIEILLECNADVSMEYKEVPKDKFYLVRGINGGKPAWH